jgi:dienelactone hydrolase
MKTTITSLLFLLLTTLHAQTPYTQSTYTYDSLINVVYGTAVDYAGNTDTLVMDIYKPHGDANCLRPIMVLVHGGDFIGGSKADVDLVYLSRNLAQKGWVVANINYRLGTHKAANYDMYAFCNTNISAPCAYICDSAEIYRANFRGMQDAKGAIRFMKNRNGMDSSDVNNVFITGESAGGFIALATAFTDQQSEKPTNCFAIGNAPNPDADMATYGCVPSPISFARPDLGSIDGTLNMGLYDAKVKGVGNFFGGVLDLNVFQQTNDTPAVYMFHQGSDVVVNYNYGQVLGRTSWECYAQTNLCQTYFFYPFAYGSEGIRQYFVSLGANAPLYQADIINNYNYMNDCLANGHSIDNVQTRLQNLVNLFAPLIAASGNNPATNCQSLSVNEQTKFSSFLIYPNPAADEINVQLFQPMTNPTISIYSSLGELVFREQKNSGSVQLLNFTAHLDAGSYFMTLESNGVKIIQPLMIAR